jgi:aminoglycoside/choline kinase family phosphotransferase
MNNRVAEIDAFLAQAGWSKAQQVPVAADFSTRRFTRLKRENGTVSTAILMDADPDQKTAQFVALGGLLRALDLSAPEIYAEDRAAGLVLMEDFGDRNMGRMIDAGDDAKPLYRRAVNGLAHLHKHFDPGMAKNFDLPVYGGALLASQAELFLDAWFPFAKNREATKEEAEAFRAACKQALKGIESLPQTLMLRDFMPDNLMDLPGREGRRAVGLLDFQDGGIGPLPYDLASLCEVVRRDLPVPLDEMIDCYCAQAAPKIGKEDLHRACRILAAQRHIRILGIIARRTRVTGNRDKLVYAPRIWEYLGELMRDEALGPLKAWIQAHVLLGLRPVA